MRSQRRDTLFVSGQALTRIGVLALGLVQLVGVLAFAQSGIVSQDRPIFEVKVNEVMKGAVGPFESHSDGYGNPGSSGLGYVAALTMETAKAPSDLYPKINQILPFDIAEAVGTYIGQINLIQASSFSGPNGLVWGYHIAKSDSIVGGNVRKLFTKEARDGSKAPVYDIKPLLDAGRRLFGTREHPRYPMLPGAQIIAAYKSHTATGPTTVWCVLGLGIASDPRRNANVFMEACDDIKGKTDDAVFNKLLHDLAESVMRVGQHQNVTYKEIYVGYKSEFVPKGYVGTALAAVPYVVLAKQAIPKEGPEELLKLSLSDWEKQLGLSPP